MFESHTIILKRQGGFNIYLGTNSQELLENCKETELTCEDKS